jgi:hypothetical protein
MDEDMVAALDATQAEAKALDQVDEVGKANVPGSVQYAEQQAPTVHNQVASIAQPVMPTVPFANRR